MPSLPPHTIVWVEKTRTEFKDGIACVTLTSGGATIEYRELPSTLVESVADSKQAYAQFIASQGADVRRMRDAPA